MGQHDEDPERIEAVRVGCPRQVPGLLLPAPGRSLEPDRRDWLVKLAERGAQDPAEPVLVGWCEPGIAGAAYPGHPPRHLRGSPLHHRVLFH